MMSVTFLLLLGFVGLKSIDSDVNVIAYLTPGCLMSIVPVHHLHAIAPLALQCSPQPFTNVGRMCPASLQSLSCLRMVLKCNNGSNLKKKVGWGSTRSARPRNPLWRTLPLGEVCDNR
jgi:hypothetical protein